ncbi:MAG: hypothetical protein V7603_5900 [Micromonosporaceae bacterium]
MIHEVDDALRRLVKDEALRGTDIEVAFEAPTKEWSARRNAPTVNLYLYDIREDMRRRSRGLINEYRTDGTVAARHVPPRYMKLSYLLTAWTQRPEDEHRLLSALLASFLRHEAVPPVLLAGSLAGLGLPVPMTVALPPPEDRAFADVWTALGGELKPSLDVVVSTPVDVGTAVEAGPPVTEGMRLDVDGDGGLGHRVTAAPDATKDGAGAAADPGAAEGAAAGAAGGSGGRSGGRRSGAARSGGRSAGSRSAAPPRRVQPGDVIRVAMIRRRPE